MGGFLVLSSFMTQEVAETGVMPMPKDGDSILGGHAVQCCGYDDDRGAFIVRNSWGEGWGASGYFFMPYAYMVHPVLVQDIRAGPDRRRAFPSARIQAKRRWPFGTVVVISPPGGRRATSQRPGGDRFRTIHLRAIILPQTHGARRGPHVMTVAAALIQRSLATKAINSCRALSGAARRFTVQVAVLIWGCGPTVHVSSD